MSEISTNLKIKTASGYTQKYPVSKATLIKRDTTSTPTIVGNTLQECLQSTANRYIPQNGKSWITYTLPSTSDGKAICSDGNFMFIKCGSSCKWSFNGGKSFTGSGTLSTDTRVANSTVVNCKRVKKSGVVYSYHVAIAISNEVYSIRIDGGSTTISDTNEPVTTTISSPNSIYFTDGNWYVYGANKVAIIADLDGGEATEITQTTHTHISKSMYASDMGMYVTIDNGNVILSNAKVGESQ